jgi:hypothetical protein
MITERNIIVISGLNVVDPSNISWKTEEMVKVLLRIRKCDVRLLVNPMEVLENTGICVAYNKRKFVASHRQVKLLLLRMAGSVEIQTNTAKLRYVGLHVRVDNLEVMNAVIHVRSEKPLLYKLVNAIDYLVRVKLCCGDGKPRVEKSKKAASILQTRYETPINKVRGRQKCPPLLRRLFPKELLVLL